MAIISILCPWDKTRKGFSYMGNSPDRFPFLAAMSSSRSDYITQFVRSFVRSSVRSSIRSSVCPLFLTLKSKHRCFDISDVSPVFHLCFTNVFPLFSQCFTPVTPVFSQCFDSVSPVFHQCMFLDICLSNIYHGDICSGDICSGDICPCSHI